MQIFTGTVHKKRIAVSGKRQITIPIEFYNQLGIEREVECYVKNGCMIVRPASEAANGAFAEEILRDLIEQGLSGEALLAQFKQANRGIRPAVERMIAEADAIGAGEVSAADMRSVFGEASD